MKCLPPQGLKSEPCIMMRCAVSTVLKDDGDGKAFRPALPNTRESFKDIEITRFRANL